MSEVCYSIVRKPKGFATSNEITLKRRIEGDDLSKCQSAIEELLQGVLDGEKFPTNLMMSVINRYQMNRFTGANGKDKRLKKLLYILWECLPKRGPDGKFLDKMVLVCSAFDKDLKHPNQYVCGTVLRTLSKTREPEVIRELVHSIEKCLEWSHAYQRKNAVLALAQVYKNFPELDPNIPPLIAEYLIKERNDECKRDALQALLEIAPEEARSYLHSCNLPDIHCMNASIQLLFVELIQKLYKKGSEDCETYIHILTSLIRSSSSPSVRYQAATTLMRFSSDPENIKLVASCFIDICAKESDNNVKLIALNSLINLRRINLAERVLRDSMLDILCILQSATDYELHEKILRLTLDLVSPINVGQVVTALKQEIKKMQDSNVLSTPQETIKYRRLVIDTVQKLAERFPNAMVEMEMIDNLFNLLTCSSIGEKEASRLILLFQVFMSRNPNHQALLLGKIQDCFNLCKDSSFIHRGLIQAMGDFSDTKEQIERSYKVIKESLGTLPIVASEKQKANPNSEGVDEAATDEVDKKKSTNGEVNQITKKMGHMVTADGSYATQSAINYQSSYSDEDIPPLRSYYLKNRFDTASVLCYALLKMTCRYQQIVSSKALSGKMIARSMYIVASILNLGHNDLVDADGNQIHISNDHTENLLLTLNILQQLTSGDGSEAANIIKKIVVDNMRPQLKSIVQNLGQEQFSSTFSKKQSKKSRFDDNISISLFSVPTEGMEFEDEDEEEIPVQSMAMPDMFEEIPLTGTIDPIYAYCEFDVNQYDIGLKIHLENRTKTKTFENVTLELAARGNGTCSLIDRTASIVLGPRATTCICTSVKVVSAENRRLFGSISFDDAGSDDKEQVIMLNDISVNITDYIKPASISFDDFKDLWRDCVWENKVTVKTKLTSLKEYLTHLVVATNMRCVTSDRGLSGDCLFLSANLYARSIFGEEALVNVSIEKETPSSVVTGNVKIRSQLQGMALSLGEKIQCAAELAK